MKKAYRTYFCVTTEIYGCGAVKAAVTGSRSCIKRPLNSYREFPGMTAFKDWFGSREQAGAHLRERGL